MAIQGCADGDLASGILVIRRTVFAMIFQLGAVGDQ